jgi:signal peptidase
MKNKKDIEKQIENMSALGIIKWIARFLSKVILYSILVIFSGLIAILVLYFIDQTKNMGKGKGPLFNAYVIVSPSMHPTIKVHDVILVKRKDVDELKVGDIINNVSTDPRYSGLTVTHRIVKIQKSEEGKIMFTTRGDNNNTEDATYVTEENLYGKVILKIPKIGHLQSFLLNIYGWILIIVIPCITVIVYDLVKLFRSFGKKGQKEKAKTEAIKKKDRIETLSTDNNIKEEQEEIEILDISEEGNDSNEGKQ